ncbi:Phosphopantetheine attachment site [Micromonospora nigra]|uniref:Phosphopantetheine attachment site n=1 Tax=Micromonospora nigra TaxID=145857 RepID=A0A1C6SZ75_9ACTN|nr:acyl carrier protein [Micromonospora nigra]SCL34837.1 Phosphopantetheine attachment site [Micromonospora nigra]
MPTHRRHIAELVSQATEGVVGVEDALAGESLVVLGVDSLGLLRLVDAIEQTYGVEIDLYGAVGLDTVDDIAAAVARAAEVDPADA